MEGDPNKKKKVVRRKIKRPQNAIPDDILNDKEVSVGGGREGEGGGGRKRSDGSSSRASRRSDEEHQQEGGLT